MQKYHNIKEDAKRTFIKERNRFYKGFGELTSVRQLIQIFILIEIYLVGVLETSIHWGFYILGGILAISSCWALGLLWDRSHLYHYEAEFGNERNWFVKEMRKMQEEIKGLRRDIKNVKRKD